MVFLKFHFKLKTKMLFTEIHHCFISTVVNNKTMLLEKYNQAPMIIFYLCNDFRNIHFKSCKNDPVFQNSE
jgi:hypothetical protein